VIRLLRPARFAILAVLVLFPRVSAGASEPAGLDPSLRIALRSRFAASRLSPSGPDSLVPCFVTGTVSDADLRARGARTGARAGDLRTARIPLRALETIAALDGVRSIRAAHRLAPQLDVSLADIGGDLVHAGAPDTALGTTGDSVFVGVVDTGIDWTHQDFKQPGVETRIAVIWDQTDTIGPPPAGYAYGSAWTSAQIDLGTCRETDNTYYGHGTHVAGIAAGSGRATGNGVPAFTYVGVAPHAVIGMVKTSFYDTDIVDGVAWLFQQAQALGLPAVVNLSLGGAYGPHDGTTDMELALDALSGPGRVVVAGSGNSRNIGMHGERIVPGIGEGLLSFRIFNYTPSPSVTEGLALDGWYAGGQNVLVSLRTPGGVTVGPVAKGASLVVPTVEGLVTIDHTGVEAMNTNGDVEVVIVVSDEAGANVAAGDWEIHLSLASGANVETDFWIFDEAFPFPPAFVNGKQETELVLAPASADSVIAVGAHVTKASWTALNGSVNGFGQTLNQIATFSCNGPRRDGVLKPELAAPGSAIGSTHSAASQPNPAQYILPDGVHKILQGTSMSCPHATGAVALLLARWPQLSSAQVRAALEAGCRSDGTTGAVPNNLWGWGRLDVARTLADRLAFATASDETLMVTAGTRVDLTDLCATLLPGTWTTRFALHVDDTHDWLELADGGPAAPIAAYDGLSPVAGAGVAVCAPLSGTLSVLVPADAAGDSTLVTFTAAPDKLPFLAASRTILLRAGASSAAPEPGPTGGPLRFTGAARRGDSWVMTLAPHAAGRLDAALFDVRGRRIAVLLSGARVAAGASEIAWDGRDDGGRRVPAGVYFVRARGFGKTATERVVVTP